MVYSEKNLKVLSIQDAGVSCDLLFKELTKLNESLIFKRVSSVLELEAELKHQSWNLVISNYDIPGLSVLSALRSVRRFTPDLPFLLFCDSIKEESVADMMKAGVEDVVLKGRPERLATVVNRVLREHDIKEKEIRAQRRANEAFAAKEQMLAIVSHDIKNPLSAIQLEAQMLLKTAERGAPSLLSEEVRIQANRILKTTDRLKILISDLLDKNKTENGLGNLSKNSIDATRLLLEVLDTMKPLLKEKGILLSTSLPQEISICLDRNKMFQVFSNLINNAIKFTPASGTIQISFEEDQREYFFSVRDSGPGLKDKELKNVFEKYWTGNESDCAGTGLGLFICKTIVEAHGGRIFVENVQEGACFKFTIPKGPGFVDADPREDSKKKIFIVDDDEDLREVISWALGKEGFSIHSFSSPQEALERLKEGRHAPDLIVVDFHMDEMKGSDFVKKKSKLRTVSDCPVVMISASPEEVEREVPQELYKNVLTKPIDLEGLVDNVRRYLN